jgi:hypothetical protein
MSPVALQGGLAGDVGRACWRRGIPIVASRSHSAALPNPLVAVPPITRFDKNLMKQISSSPGNAANELGR